MVEWLSSTFIFIVSSLGVVLVLACLILIASIGAIITEVFANVLLLIGLVEVKEYIRICKSNAIT